MAQNKYMSHYENLTNQTPPVDEDGMPYLLAEHEVIGAVDPQDCEHYDRHESMSSIAPDGSFSIWETCDDCGTVLGCTGIDSVL